MGFFTKTREKGLKSVTKEKLKKSNATKSAEKKANANEFKNPSTEEQDKKRIKSSTETNTKVTTTSTAQAPMNTGMPWWISDASFMVEGKKISAHKVVVSSKSKVLAQLIESTPNGVVEIVTYPHNIFSQLIKWVYGSRFEVSAEDATSLKACALEFEIQDLADTCQAVELANQTKPIIVTYNLQELHNSHENDSSYQETSFEDILYDGSDYQNPLDSILTPQGTDFGMNLYSEDPILFNPDPHEVDEFRLMEIF